MRTARLRWPFRLTRDGPRELCERTDCGLRTGLCGTPRLGTTEFDVAMEIGLVVKLDVVPGDGLAVGFANPEGAGLVGIGLLNLLGGLGGSLGFDPPNLKIPQRNPRFLTFCYTDNGLGSRLYEKKYSPEGGGSGGYSTVEKGLVSSPGPYVNQER